MKKYVFMCLILICLIVIGIYFFTGKPVETEEQALEIAKAHVLRKYKNSFDEYNITVFTRDDLWIVCYFILNEDGTSPEGGEGPAVYIKKSNGRVIRSYLQL